ncbi:MAG TPA: DnaJ domain-containing protein, partial [Vicinamibacteria bacterium]|nr:DnaJ domain-containing protein [Vicinamibacteria bacterium]
LLGGATPTPGSIPLTGDRRRSSRLDISVDVVMRRLDSGGQPLHEERTVADNIGLHGARVLTGMKDVGVGDRVSLEEVGSDFRTRAAVRNTYTGKDSIPRLGVEFLDRTAPDHLVPKDDSKSRIPRPPLPPPDRTPESVRATTPPPGAAIVDMARLEERRREILEAYEGLKTRNHFEVLGLPRASNATQVKEAYIRLAKRFHPDAREPELAHLKREAEAVFLRIGEAYEVLIDAERRSRYENGLGRSSSRPPMAAPPPPTPPPTPAPASPMQAPEPASPRDRESDSRIAAQILSDAKKLLAEERYWDAIQSLESALDLAKGGRVNHAIRILLARATSKNPKWQKRAENILLSVIEEDPRNVEAHFVLGTLYKSAGLAGRAAAQFKTVLQLDPRHVDASVALRSVDPSSRRRQGAP